MSRSSRLRSLALAGLILGVGLAGCGGGGGGSAGCGVPPVDIAPNDTVNGALGPGDCTIRQILGFDDDSRADRYRVTLPSAGSLTVRMESTEIDSFLALTDVDMTTVIAFDDDSGGAFDALISSFPLTAGTYIIFANSILPENGSYTLTTSFTPDAVTLGVEEGHPAVALEAPGPDGQTDKEASKLLRWEIAPAR